MILNRIEDPKLFEQYIKKKETKIKPVEKVSEIYNNPNKLKSSDGDTFEQNPSELCFAQMLKQEIAKQNSNYR